MLMTGLGSGIDYEAMIQAIVAAERAPVENQLNRQEGMNTAEMDALKEIQGALNSFRDTVEDLNAYTELNKLKAELSNTDVMGVAVSGGAVSGEYNFDVTQLAQAARDKVLTMKKGSYLTTGEVEFTTDKGTVSVDIAALATELKTKEESKKAQFRTDTLTEVAKEHNIDTTKDGWETEAEAKLAEDKEAKASFDARIKEYDQNIARYRDKGVTAEELQGAINRHENADGAKVTLVQTGDQLTMVLNAKDTGVANAVKGLSVTNVTAKDDTGSGVAVSDLGVQLQAAQDAVVKFGNMELTSPTNKMENVIDGITLTLKETGTVNVNIQRDEDGVKETVKTFIDSYNKVVETVNTYTKSSEEMAAALSGDAATRSMISRLRSVISDQYASSTLGTLSQLGITTKMDGTLELESDKFDKAMEDNFDEIAKLFMGDPASSVPEKQTGIMGSMLTVLDDYHKNGGLFDVRIDRLDADNQRLQEEREALDARMEAKALSLRDYYAKMDSQIAQMNQTQSMLISMLM